MESKSRWSLRVTARVRKALKDSGLTDTRIAELSGIPRTTFHRRVTGVDPWNTAQLEAVAKAIEVDPDTLLTASDKKTGLAS